jgi:hypothetical protein
MTACHNSISVEYHDIWHWEVLGKFVDTLQILINPANSKGQLLRTKTFIPFWANRERNSLIVLQNEKRLERFYLSVTVLASG